MVQPTRFTDRSEADQWLHQTFAPWAASLTIAEISAIRAYKGMAHDPINEALRFDLDLDEINEQRIIALDRALSRFQLPEPIIVWRAFASETLRTSGQVGLEIVDAGYFSTTLLHVVAMELFNFEAHEARLIAEVTLPGGQHVATSVGAPDLIQDFAEQEILLPRDSRFRITGRPAADHIQLEVILE